MRNYATMKSAILAVLEAELNCNRSGDNMLLAERGNLTVDLRKSPKAEYPDIIDINIRTMNFNHPFFNPISFVHGPLTQIIDGDILEFSFNYRWTQDLENEDNDDITDHYFLTVEFD